MVWKVLHRVVFTEMHIAGSRHGAGRIRLCPFHIEVPRVRAGQSGAPTPILIEARIEANGSHPVEARMLQRQASLVQVPAEAKKPAAVWFASILLFVNVNKNPGRLPAWTTVL